MLNRYQGNSGRVVRLDDSGTAYPPQRSAVSQPPASGSTARPRPQNNPVPVQKNTLSEMLSKLLPVKQGDFETEDLILLLILYLMYRESGDSELLIIMGAMFLL